MGKVKKFGIMAVLSALISLTLVACGGSASSTSAPQADPTNPPAANVPSDSNSNSADAPATSGEVQEVSVVLKEWAIEPSNIEVEAGMVRFNVTNEGQFSHNMAFQIEGEGTTVGKTKNFKSDESPQVLEVELEPGTYKMLCDIIGHPEQGMVGTLTVK
ncbi:MAG TPA: cupredoxin domain-containing protein [Chloroflexia bacterium]|nr:cupredoxin domain-containing protein [Chloroflexia bacterium]